MINNGRLSNMGTPYFETDPFETDPYWLCYMAKAIAFQLVFSQWQDAGYCNSLQVLDYTHMQKLSDRVWSNKRVDFLSLPRNHYKRSVVMGVSTQIDEMHHLCHLGKPQFWEHLEKSSTNAAGHHDWPACDGFVKAGNRGGHGHGTTG